MDSSPLAYQSPTVRHLSNAPKVEPDPRWKVLSPQSRGNDAVTDRAKEPESIDKQTWEQVKRERIQDAINETLYEIENVAPHLLDEDIDRRLYEILDTRVDVEVIFAGTIFDIVSRATTDIFFHTPELRLAKDRLDHYVDILDFPEQARPTANAVLDVLLLDHVGKGSVAVSESSIANIEIRLGTLRGSVKL